MTKYFVGIHGVFQMFDTQQQALDKVKNLTERFKGVKIECYSGKNVIKDKEDS